MDAAVVRLLRLPQLEEVHDELVHLEEGLPRPLEPAALDPPLPVDARDADGPPQPRVQPELVEEVLVDEGRRLAPLRDEALALLRSVVAPLAPFQAYSAEEAEMHGDSVCVLLGLSSILGLYTVVRLLPMFEMHLLV